MTESKIQDESEIIRWFSEGRTYAWMTEEYERKYNISTGPSLWADFRRSKGLNRGIVHSDDLIPWAVKEEHCRAFPLALLRMEARQRGGVELSKLDRCRLDSWHEKLAIDDLVVHYDPDTDEGFLYVRRRPGIDDDLIHEPEENIAT